MSWQWTDWATFIVDALTGAAIIFAVWQLMFHSRQMHRDLESLYVQRYWELMDRRSIGWVTEDKTAPEDLPVIRAYLQLCEDEIELRKRGRVTDSTWAFWAVAIRDQCSQEPYAAALSDLPEEDLPSLRGLLAGEAEPLTWSKARRKLHGL